MRKSHGNALFLILIAVALFAALSYAITSSGRGGGNIDREKRNIAISQFLDQTGLYHHAIQRMLVAYGVDETEISFVNDVWPSWLNAETHHGNTNCTVDTCKVFHPAGGGIPYMDPPVILTQDITPDNFYIFSGTLFVPGMGDDNEAELIGAVRVSQETCIKINDLLGIDNPSGAPPQIPGSAALLGSPFDGTYNSSAPVVSNTVPAELAGKNAGCVNQQHGYYSGDYAWFYSVLLPR